MLLSRLSFLLAFWCPSVLAQETLRPFSARTIAKYQRLDGSQFQLKGRYAQSADGNTALVGDNEPGSRGEYFHLLNVMDRRMVCGDSMLRAVLVTPVLDLKSILPHYSCEELRNDRWRMVGASVIHGFRVEEFVEEEATDAGFSYVLRLWVAPDLNCFPLRRTAVENGVRVEEVVVESIEVGEPPASVFKAPEGYEPVSPKEFEARYRAKFPGQQQMSDEIVERLEQSYQRAVEASRQRRP